MRRDPAGELPGALGATPARRSSVASGPLNDAEVIRSMIEHEGDLLNHRITWMVTLQGLLFAALGFAWDKKDAGGLILVFGLLGLVVSISSAASFGAAIRAEKRLLAWWDENTRDYSGPDVVGWRASNGFSERLYPWRVLPIVFFLAWSGVLYFNQVRSSNAEQPAKDTAQTAPGPQSCRTLISPSNVERLGEGFDLQGDSGVGV
jgi:hypothetical protein